MAEKRLHINLREERIKRDYSLQDISIRTNIPLPHLEALETGIVPQKLRGRKLGTYKRLYLEFLGFPIDAKLRFKMKSPKYEKTNTRRTRTSTTASQKIEHPSTMKAIGAGLALAGAMLGILKITSFVSEQNPTLFVDSSEERNEKNEQPILEDLAGSSLKSPIPSLLAPAISTAISTAQAEELPEVIQKGLFKNQLIVVASDRTKIEVHCDGRVLASRRLNPSDTIVCQYNHEASVFIHDLSRVKIENNERFIHPMGPLSKGRKLTFKD